MDLQISYFDKSSIHKLDWKSYLHGEYFQRLYAQLIQKGTAHFIRNVENPLAILCVENRMYPLVLGSTKIQTDKSYVASLYSQYVLYGKREIDIEFDNKLLASLGKMILGSLAWVFGFKKMDQAVFVNNWMLSTNLYPKEIPIKHLGAIRDFLLTKFPDRVIVFRSLTYFLHTDILRDLQQLGFREIFSRKIFLTSTEEPRQYRKKRNFGHDLKLWKKQSVRFAWEKLERIDEQLAKKIHRLYSQLYIEKYADFNPKFTEAFFLHMINHKILNTYLLREKEEIIAVIGYFRFEDVQTASVIGYDQNYSQKEGLYRLISLKIVELAEENKAILHASSGVSKFKASRGLQDYSEYNLIYTQHIPLLSRIRWKVLKILANDITVPLMRKFDI